MPDGTDGTDSTDSTGTIEELETAQSPEVPADPAGSAIEVRRHVALSAVVGGFAALLTVAFAVRAFTDGTGLDWLLFGVLAVITIVHVATLIDARAPLLVVDALGVRLRQGALWRGIAWAEIDCLEYLPRRGLLRDGHLLVDGYDDQQLVVPLTLATQIHGASRGTLSDLLAELADGRCDVVEVVPGLNDEAESAPAEDAAPAQDPAPEESVERTDEIVLPPEHADRTDAGPDEVDEVDEVDEAEEPPPAPGRATVLPARVELDGTAAVRPAAPSPLTDPALSLEQDTVVLADLALHPAAEPVIGPQLVAARERLRLSIDQLSERTRIRPHVIESMEVDDFGPCGGDFYARGHLRTLARVLGIDVAPLIAAYDETYADAPLDPRRVFESELATGAGGAIRSTRGGRNWSVLIAAVMGAVLVWSLAQLLMDAPAQRAAAPVLNQSGGVSTTPAAKGETVKITLTAAGGGAQLVVRDGAGEIAFDGDLAFGQTTVLRVVAPIRIWTSDGSVTYALGKDRAAPLGEIGTEVSKTLVAR